MLHDSRIVFSILIVYVSFVALENKAALLFIFIFVCVILYYFCIVLLYLKII
jgi:hypothetical protein